MNPVHFIFIVSILTLVLIALYKLFSSLKILYILKRLNKLIYADFPYIVLEWREIYDYQLIVFLNKYIYCILHYNNELHMLYKHIQSEYVNGCLDECMSDCYHYLLKYYSNFIQYEKILINNLIVNRSDRQYMWNKLKEVEVNITTMVESREYFKEKNYKKLIEILKRKRRSMSYNNMEKLNSIIVNYF